MGPKISNIGAPNPPPPRNPAPQPPSPKRALKAVKYQQHHFSKNKTHLLI